ncbi:MAG TPA: STAS domain-containing protein [Acidimicrobiia bacterium]|jgi:anti-anti-sigma regulatory factor|nr:STAS domain-containing protein [Acidimicrobiia bacterium]
MIVPVFTPPPRIDATNVAAFAKRVREHVDGHGGMVIDCSEVVWIAACGMHVLEMAAKDAPVTLVNPSPTVHLMAATFGGDVESRYERMSTASPEPGVPHRGLRAVPTGGRVAS